MNSLMLIAIFMMIKQIKEKRYSGALKGYKNEILLVGINYNKDKHHECVIESITPEW